MYCNYSHCGEDDAWGGEESAEEPDGDDGRHHAPLRVARPQRPHDRLVPAKEIGCVNGLSMLSVLTDTLEKRFREWPS